MTIKLFMLEGTLLGLMYVLVVCAGILGLYVLAFLIMYLIKLYRQYINARQQVQQYNLQDTMKDSLIIKIND